jgi:hypothetical protein
MHAITIYHARRDVGKQRTSIGQGRAHSIVATRNCAFCRKGAASSLSASEVREGGAGRGAATAPFIDAAQPIAAGQ